VQGKRVDHEGIALKQCNVAVKDGHEALRSWQCATSIYIPALVTRTSEILSAINTRQSI
jgi:hypothetical protein